MMTGSTVRYIDWQESLKQGSLDNTPMIYDILQNNVLCYIQNSNMGCGTCRLYIFQLNRPIQINWTPLNIYSSAYENFRQASNLSLVQIACKLTYIPYANNYFNIRKQF